MKYTVVWADGIVILQQKVNVYLKEGWKLQGGIAATKTGDYIQAMVKEEG